MLAHLKIKVISNCLRKSIKIVKSNIWLDRKVKVFNKVLDEEFGNQKTDGVFVRDLNLA